MFKQLLLFWVCVLIINTAQSQTPIPYTLHWGHESIYTAYSLAGLATIYSLNKQMEGHSLQEIQSLNSATIWRIDRNTIYKYSEQKAHISDYVVGTACIVSVGGAGLIALQAAHDKQSFIRHAGTFAILWAETNAVTMITTNIAKSSVRRTRPYVYNSEVTMETKMEKDSRKSFFSGHTAFSASNCFFAAQVVSQYYPKSTISYASWGLATLIPASVAYLRVQSGRHFPTDVISGYIIGAACGILIPYVHTRGIDNKSNVQIGMSPQVISVSLGF